MPDGPTTSACPTMPSNVRGRSVSASGGVAIRVTSYVSVRKETEPSPLRKETTLQGVSL